jgi:hypothetical protein
MCEVSGLVGNGILYRAGLKQQYWRISVKGVPLRLMLAAAVCCVVSVDARACLLLCNRF